MPDMSLFPRVAQLLGAPPELASYDQIAGIVGNPNATEGQDLEFKGELYAAGFDKRSELAKDVTSFANATGGVIIIGLREDRRTSVPAAVNPVSLTDQLRRDYLQSIAGRIDDRFDFKIHFAADPAQPSHGFLLIEVPPSPARPHAVIGVKDLRDGATVWPQRVDNATVYLTPAQVRTMVMETARLRSERAEQRDALERRLVQDHLQGAQEGRHYARLVVTLMPHAPGHMQLDGTSLDRFTSELAEETLWAAEPKFLFSEVWPSGEGIRACASQELKSTNAVFAYDGTGVIDFEVEHHRPRKSWPHEEAETPMEIISPGDVAGMTLCALGVLARHAAHRAGTRGMCELRVRLLSAPAAMPGLHRGGPLVQPVELGTSGFSPRSATHAVVEAAAAIEELLDPGPATVKAADRLLTRLHHHFGEPQSVFTRSDGSLVRDQRTPYFPSQPLYDWAERHGLTITAP